MELNGSQTKNASCYHSRPNDLLNYYGQVDFRVFRPARTTCCTDEGEMWRGGVDLTVNFAKSKNIIAQRAYPLRDYYEIVTIYG